MKKARTCGITRERPQGHFDREGRFLLKPHLHPAVPTTVAAECTIHVGSKSRRTSRRSSGARSTAASRGIPATLSVNGFARTSKRSSAR